MSHPNDPGLAISTETPATSQERLIELAYRVASMMGEVDHSVHVLQQPHPQAAFLAVSSTIITPGKPQVRLAGVIIPIELLQQLRQEALALIRERGAGQAVEGADEAQDDG